MSLSLARKYRPRRFADVAVQSHVSATLQGAIAKNRVAHGYLFCGPRGTGKTTLARVLAMALNCENAAVRSQGEPCGECESCRRIWAGSASLDVIEIDAASNRGVDDARELRERAMYAPSGDDRYKVYIVDEAHMLTREAWNALLKILEEPPPRVVFVFATTEPQKITQTAAPVMSRLQRFDLRRIGPADIKARLAAVLGAEGVAADGDALSLIARAADGSMRDALSLTDQVLSLSDGGVTPDRVRDALGLVPEDEYLALLDIVAGHRAAEVFPYVATLADAGADFSTFMAGFGDMVRSQLAVVLGGRAPDVSERAHAALVDGASRFQAADLIRMLNALTELEPRFRRSGQQRLLVETMLVRLTLQDRTVDIEALLRGSGGGTPSASGPSPSGPSPSGGPPSGASPPGASSPRTAASGTPPVASSERVSQPGPGSSQSGASGREAAGGQQAGASEGTARARLGSEDSRGAPRSGATDRPTGAGQHSDPIMSASRAVDPTVGAARPRGGHAAPAARPAAGPGPTPAAGSAQPVAALSGGLPPLDINAVTGRWDDLVARLRQGGKTLVATALEHATPSSVTSRGSVSITLDEPNDFYAKAIQSGAGEIAIVLRTWFSPVERVVLEGMAAPAGPPKRMTDEMVKAEKLEALKKKDPLLLAAIEALDLEVID